MIVSYYLISLLSTGHIVGPDGTKTRWRGVFPLLGWGGGGGGGQNMA